MIFKILMIFLFLIVGIIPNFNAADKIGAQWIYISFINLISLILNRSQIVDLKKFHILFKIQGLLVLWGILSYFYSFNKVETLIEGSRLFLIYLSCFNIFLLLRGLDNSTVKKLIIYFGPFLLFLECFFVFKDFLEFKDTFFDLGRQSIIKGIAANINITAFSLVVKISMCFYLLKQKGFIFLKIITSILLFFGFISIYITGSRGGLLSIYCIFILYSITTFFNKKISLKSKLFSFSFLSIPLMMSIFTSEYLFRDNKMNPIYRSQEIINRGSKSRIRYYKQAFNQIKSSPFFGVGLGNWKLYSIESDKEDMNQYIVPYHAHNDFLQTGAELGMVGFLLYLTTFLIPLYIGYFKKKLKQLYNDEILMIYAVTGVLFVDSCLNFPISRPIMQMPLMFVFAFIIYLDTKENNEN